MLMEGFFLFIFITITYTWDKTVNLIEGIFVNIKTIADQIED
jgi:hypothetical protein